MRGLALVLLVLGAASASAQAPSLDGAVVLDVEAEPTAYRGRPALRVVDATEAADATDARLVLFPDLRLGDGTLEVWLAARPTPGAPPQACGFVGLAFGVDPEAESFEAFYLRMTNGRAEAQPLRNHASQYVSVPAWPWRRLREERPAAYEAYVDLVVGAWTRVRIEVDGDVARLYVHDGDQPTILAQRLLAGDGTGAVGLWIGPWTEAYFAGLTVTEAE
ncbi:MAG: hypothetical protein AAF845_14225 [Bacteroidota bacterium]